MRIPTKPWIAAYSFAMLSLVSCAEHATLKNEPSEATDKVESQLAIKDVGPIVGPSDPFGYNTCTGRIFPPFFGDLVDASNIPDFFFERLTRTDVAVSLPQPHLLKGKEAKRAERPSLISVAGSKQAPLLLANAEVQAKRGRLKQSPGPDFDSTLVLFDEKEVVKLDEHHAALKQAGELSKEGLVFQGRHPIAKALTRAPSVTGMVSGDLVAFPIAPISPASTEANWLESLMITDKTVVQDPKRTYDPCTEAGNADGVWTFKHLMTEMANEPRSGLTPEDFTIEFLLTWLFPRSINSDFVSERPAMWDAVIEPWLVASGGQTLDLDKAPFRLLAIVNRLDLRKTTAGGGYFGGGGIPIDAGELRFVFGVVTPPAYSQSGKCETHEFTTILEYGVPISGCSGVRDWAREWTKLNVYPAYGEAYRNQLESLTERVVERNAAPFKGNGSAINQIRTNEAALALPWELNEFTLTNESAGNTPVDGALRPHTVAQTPDDGVYSPTPNPVVSDYINSEVSCSGNHEVPLSYDGAPFRGGNSLMGKGPGSPPGTWFGDGPNTPDYICRRHTFSLNTCNGCHSCDTGTEFVHVSPTSGIPAKLSGFLTGTSVEDTQFPSSKTWTFADLDRRFVDLYSVANSVCLIIPPLQFEMANIVLERFPDPVFDVSKAIAILDQVEREALKRLPANAQPDPNLGVLVSDIGRLNPTAAH